MSCSATSLVLGASTVNELRHDQAILAHQLRQHRLQRAAVHLLVHLLREVARLRGERTATAHPDRRTDRAGARGAATFLRTRLAATATHFGLGQLGLGARAAGVAIRRDHLVHQRFVEFLAEDRVGNRELGATIGNFEFHVGHRLFLGRSRGLGSRLLGRRDLLAILLGRGLHRRTHDDLAALRRPEPRR